MIHIDRDNLDARAAYLGEHNVRKRMMRVAHEHLATRSAVRARAVQFRRYPMPARIEFTPLQRVLCPLPDRTSIPLCDVAELSYPQALDEQHTGVDDDGVDPIEDTQRRRP